MKLIDYLSKIPRTNLLTSGISSVVIIGFLDYITGPEISFSIFYLIPISVVALIAGAKDGIILSVFGAIAWFVADLFAGHVYTSTAIPYWNAGVRLGLFLIVTFSLSALTSTQKRREELCNLSSTTCVLPCRTSSRVCKGYSILVRRSWMKL